jgi:predicted RNA-binding Zn ribbon-like protein
MVEEISVPKRAPAPLDVLQRFVNSVSFERNEEELDTPEALGAWLAEHGLMAPGDPVTEGDLRRAVDVREGLRALLFANNGYPLDTSAVERLDLAASRAGVRLRFDEKDGSPTLEPDATGVDGAIARLMAAVAEANLEGSWKRLKACPEDTCRWAFYDRSKNRSAKWCSMETCGNMAKARAYRARHRKATA